MTVRSPFDPTQRARIGLGAMGAGLLDTLVAQVTETARNDATTWLVQQYATLRALPDRLHRVQDFASRLADAIGTPSAETTDASAQLLQANQTILGLLAGYPAMMESVDAAYTAVQNVGLSNVSLALAGAVASAVFQASEALHQASDAESQVADVGQRLVQQGVLTPAQLGAAQAPTVGLSRKALYVLGGVVALFVLPRILRGARR